jgi:hypothetical protein
MQKRQRILTPALCVILLTVASITWAAGAGWTVTPSPNPGTTNFLQGVAAISSTDAWAVGYDYDVNDHQFTVTQHWDGSKWNLAPSPSPGTGRRCGDASYA